MNRAAAFTFAATLAVSAGAVSTSACGGVVEGSDDGNAQTEDAGSGTAMYGLPIGVDGGTANDDGSTGAMYGVARFDSGEPEDAGQPTPAYGLPFPEDAGPPDDDGGLVAAYGLPGH